MAILSAGIVTMLGGCDANQLYMGSRTVVGVNAAIDSTQTKGWVVVGYDRNFVAIIPRSVDGTGTDTGKQDVMAALACSRLEVKGITIKHYKESIATGRAAQDFAANLHTDPKVIKDFFDCFKDKPDPKPSAALPGGGTDQ
ncbi:MAG: hypothetical protein E6G95_12915 [Alphaproteobacteria bacterium]|nr:MAG: hypothetical protein E6G95_12915 [Alphaproteobacteria bacterium]